MTVLHQPAGAGGRKFERRLRRIAGPYAEGIRHVEGLARIHMIYNNAWVCVLAEISDRLFGRILIEGRLLNRPQDDGGY